MYDRTHDQVQTPHSFQERDQVWFHFDRPWFQKKQHHKLKPIHNGAYTTIESVGPRAICVDLPPHNVVNVTSLSLQAFSFGGRDCGHTCTTRWKQIIIWFIRNGCYTQAKLFFQTKFALVFPHLQQKLGKTYSKRERNDENVTIGLDDDLPSLASAHLSE